MLLQIPDVLTKDQVAEVRQALAGAEWADGKITAGHQSAKAKHNLQLPESSPVAQQIGKSIVRALGRHPLFMSAALPAKIFPPLFNRYEGGQDFGNHVDNAVRYMPNGEAVRTDVSSTLFLSEPDEYDGGELVIDDTYGAHQVKLPAGHMVIYPGTSLHRVTPITRGARIAAFFWSQSMIRDDSRRTLLFDMDMAIQRLTRDLPDHPSLIQLTATYHNLLRQWAEI
ncbi:MAG TPA: Fe2+-dependent dioxygenase [Alphaproteobacteria bacterium]|nr:Fe2+-dependent dioxygenase [Alphaproteobacteria bacterium]